MNMAANDIASKEKAFIRDVLALLKSPSSQTKSNRLNDRLKEEGGKFPEDYRKILAAAILHPLIVMFGLLDYHGVFLRALRQRDPNYMDFVSNNLYALISFGHMPHAETLVTLFPSGAQVDHYGALWRNIIQGEFHEHLDAMLAEERHIGSITFEPSKLLDDIIGIDSVEQLKIMYRHGIPMHTVSNEFGHESRPIDRAILFNSDLCADYLFSLEADHAYARGKQFPIAFYAHDGCPTLETLLVMERHAKRFGIDLETYRDSSGLCMADYFKGAGMELEAPYLEYLRIKQAEKAAESVTVAPCKHLRARL